MPVNFKNILFAGTALVALNFTTPAHAGCGLETQPAGTGTVIVPSCGVVIDHDPEATPAISFENDSWASINDGVNVTGTMTTSLNGTGLLAVQGASTFSGNIGEDGGWLKLIWSGITLDKTAAFNGNIFVKDIYSGSGTSTFNGAVTAGTINFADDFGVINLNADATVASGFDFSGYAGNLNLGAGANFYGDIESNGKINSGTLNLLGGEQVISGEIAWSSNALTEINAGADGGSATFQKEIYADAFNIVGTGAVTFSKDVYFANGLTFKGDGIVNLLFGSAEQGIMTDFNAAEDGIGILNIIDLGNDAGQNDLTIGTDLCFGVCPGSIGASGLLKEVNIEGAGNTLTIIHDFYAANRTDIGGNTVVVGDSFIAAAGQQLGFDVGKQPGLIFIQAGGGDLDPTGDALVNKATMIKLTATSRLAQDDEFILIDGSNSNGDGIATLGPGMLKNTGVITYSQVADTDNLIVKVTRHLVADTATTGNGVNIGRVFDLLDGAGSSALQDIELGLDNTDNADQFLEGLMPTVDESFRTAEFTNLDKTSEIIDTHIASIRSGDDGMSGMAAGKAANGASLWLQGYGQTARQDMRGGIAGYDADTYGGAAGADSANIMSNSILGIALNYGKTNANSKNADTAGTDVDSYGINLYGNYDLGQKMFLTGQAGYAYNKINGSRHDVGGPGQTAYADYVSNQYSAKIGIGRDYALNGMTLTPSATAAYTYLHNGGYTETGAGGGLVVDSADFDYLKLGVGIDAAWNVKNANGTRLKPSIHLGYAYNAINDKIETTSSFIGDPSGTAFNTSGPTPARSEFHAGAGVTYMTAANWDLSASYDYTCKTGYDAHAGILRATAHF
jgi:outer membrane autotransporter protein